MSDKKPTNTKETGDKDLDDLLDSKWDIILFLIQLCWWMNAQLHNVKLSICLFTALFEWISGALEDFEKGNKSSGTSKDVDSAEGAANAEIWNEEFIA